jgi:hypothetical protein
MRTILFLLTAVFFLTACEKKYDIETPEGLVQWNISKVEGQTTGTVNDTISLDVYGPTSSGCDYISKFSSDKNGNIIFIEAFGNTKSDVPCTMAAVPVIARYEFISVSKGQFELRFISRDNSVIKHHITIQ